MTELVSENRLLEADKGHTSLRRERKLAEHRRYNLNHKEERRGQELERRKHYKVMAMEVISGEASCVKCGCDDIDVLELNYIKGGHGKLVPIGNRCEEGKIRTGTLLHTDILMGRIDPSLFNVLCRVCNAVDHLPQGKNGMWLINWMGKSE